MRNLIRKILKEEIESIQQNDDSNKPKITHKNFFKTFFGRLKNKKFKDWVKKNFNGKENPSKEEILNYVKGDPPNLPSSPTEPENPTAPEPENTTISESIKSKRTKMYLFEDNVFGDTLAKAYRIWANSTDELSKKYGKTSIYKLDAKSNDPNNQYFRNSYEAGKAEYEKYLIKLKSIKHQTIIDELNKNRNPVINGLNNIIKYKAVPYLNKQLNSSINKWWGSCYSVDMFFYTDTYCFGANVDVNIPYINITDIKLSKSSTPNTTIISYAASAKVKVYVGLNAVGYNVWDPTVVVYPSVSGKMYLNHKTKTLTINPPKLNIWTSWVDVGLVYVYINNNKLKMQNRFAGPYEWALPIQQKVNQAFSGKVFSLEKDAPEINKLIS